MITRKIGAIGSSRKRPTASPVISGGELARSKSIFRKNIAYVKGVDGRTPDIKDSTLYIAADASGIAGKKDLLTANTKALVGITNFDGNKLNTGRNVVINSARLLYTTDGAEIVSADWQNEDRLPAELQNAEVVVTQGGRLVLSMPLSDLQGDKFQAWRKFANTPFLKANEPISVQLELPEGVTAPVSDGTVQSFIRFEFRVHQSKA